MYQIILVAVDGSDPSNCAVLEAVMLAQMGNAELKLLQVADEHVMDTGYCIGTYASELAETSREHGKKVLHNAAGLARRNGLVPTTLGIESLGGRIAPIVMAPAKAWTADLIVMGTHGRRGIKRPTTGSDAANPTLAAHA